MYLLNSPVRLRQAICLVSILVILLVSHKEHSAGHVIGHPFVLQLGEAVKLSGHHKVVVVYTLYISAVFVSLHHEINHVRLALKARIARIVIVFHALDIADKQTGKLVLRCRDIVYVYVHLLPGIGFDIFANGQLRNCHSQDKILGRLCCLFLVLGRQINRFVGIEIGRRPLHRDCGKTDRKRVKDERTHIMLVKGKMPRLVSHTTNLTDDAIMITWNAKAALTIGDAIGNHSRVGRCKEHNRSGRHRFAITSEHRP